MQVGMELAGWEVLVRAGKDANYMYDINDSQVYRTFTGFIHCFRCFVPLIDEGTLMLCLEDALVLSSFNFLASNSYKQLLK